MRKYAKKYIQGTLDPEHDISPHEFVHMVHEAEAVIDILQHKK